MLTVLLERVPGKVSNSLVALLLVVLVGCESAPIPNPLPAVESPAPSSLPVILKTGNCEQPTVIECIDLVVRTTVPIAGTDFTLTYASDQVPGGGAAGMPDPRSLGLGGWGLSILHVLDPDRGLLFPGDGPSRVVVPVVAGSALGADLFVASIDGFEVHRFDLRGRHLETIDALVGAVRYRFAYDPEGRLTGVTDVDGDVTAIQQDGDGRSHQPCWPAYNVRMGAEGWRDVGANSDGFHRHDLDRHDHPRRSA